MKSGRKKNYTRILLYLLPAVITLGITGVVVGGTVLGIREFKKISSSMSLALKRKTTLEQTITNLETQQQQLSYQLVTCQKQQSKILPDDFESIDYTITQGSPIGFALGSGWGVLFIDKGFKHGIKENDWVITPERNLIGKIETAHQTYSVVRTIFDNRLKIAASLAPHGAEGLFTLRGGSFVVDLVSASASTTPGIIAYTSGNDGLFPQGLVLGIVTGTKQTEQSSLQTVIVKPIWDPPRTHSVVVIRNIFQ